VFHSFGELKLLTLVGVVRKEDVQNRKMLDFRGEITEGLMARVFLLEGVMRVLPL